MCRRYRRPESLPTSITVHATPTIRREDVHPHPSFNPASNQMIRHKHARDSTRLTHENIGDRMQQLFLGIHHPSAATTAQNTVHHCQYLGSNHKPQAIRSAKVGAIISRISK